MKKILYIDLDGVVADLDKAIEEIDPGSNYQLKDLRIDNCENHQEKYDKFEQLCLEYTRIFRDLDPIEDSVESVKILDKYYDIHFLSTPMWILPESYMDKRLWIENHFGDLAKHKLILTKRKDLNIGDYLVDDTLRNGVLDFKGEHIHFGTNKFPNWEVVTEYLLKKL